MIINYALMRRLLFCLPPEVAHKIALTGLDFGLAGTIQAPFKPIKVMGITFPNSVGLAAGLDKNADHIRGLFNLGFGFIELGTVTPKPQPGNPQPRLFRIPQKQALINRLGFNNLGIDHLCKKVADYRKQNAHAVIGINIGKNANTELEKAADDYLICLRKAYPLASYITVNLSSPNTPGLRKLQHGEELKKLLHKLKSQQAALEQEHGRYVPIAIKIAPDLEPEDIQDIANTFNALEIDAVIATNTTLSRLDVKTETHGQEQGGLSGAPLTHTSTNVIQQLRKQLDKNIPIIGVGGIMSAADAQQKIAAGASLVQIYSGFIYNGPELITDICKKILL